MNNEAIFDKLDTVGPQVDSLYDSGYTTSNSDNSLEIEFVNFSGGGMAGVAFAGVVKEMERRQLREKIKYWLGSSAGAICAALCALQAPADYIIDHLMMMDSRIFLDYGGRPGGTSWWSKIMEYRYGFLELLTKLGAVRGDRFEKWFGQHMEVLGWSKELTFAELYDKTGQHLVLTTTSLNTSETLYLCRSSYPYMRILDAVHASMIVPFLIQPLYMDDPIIPQGNRLLLDGGILDNLPLNACDIVSETGEILAFNRKAIGFTLISDGKWVPEYSPINNILQFAMTFVRSLHKRIQMIQSNQPYFWNRVITIETYGVDLMDFGLPSDKVLQLIQSGQDSAARYFDKRAAMIKEYGPLPGNLFIPSPRLRDAGVRYLSDELIENTRIYQTNPAHFCNYQIKTQ